MTLCVYRLEHESIKNPQSNHYAGVFVSIDEIDYLGIQVYLDYATNSFNPHDMPHPDIDNIHHVSKNMVYGYKSISQLKKWFPCKEGRKGIYSFNYVLRCYNIEPIFCKIGAYQVAFCPSNATTVVKCKNV